MRCLYKDSVLPARETSYCPLKPPRVLVYPTVDVFLPLFITDPDDMTSSNGTNANGNGHAASSSTSAPSKLRVAVIPGDGIGKEVMPVGLDALRAVAKR